MKHSDEEVQIITEYLRHYNGEADIYVVRDFIRDNFGTTWSVRDEQTIRYLQSFIDNSKNKKIKLDNN